MYLNLGVNLLSALPQAIENLPYLRELVISDNRYVKRIKTLQKLSFCFRFTEIPGCVYNLPTLQILLAGGNKITSINVAGLSKLKHLAVLDLSNNNISQVPPQLGNMKQLRLDYKLNSTLTLLNRPLQTFLS